MKTHKYTNEHTMSKIFKTNYSNLGEQLATLKKNSLQNIGTFCPEIALSEILLRNNLGQMWWLTPVIPATQEAEAGGW